MKLAVVTNSVTRSAGGLFYSVRELSYELSKLSSFEIEVLGLKDEFFESDKTLWEGISLKTFTNISERFKFGFSFQMLKHIFKSDCDLIHLHGIWNFASLIVLIRTLIRPVPYIVSPRGMLDVWILNKNRKIKKVYWLLIEKRLLSNAKYIHALNESEKLSILAVLPKANVFVSPNGVKSLPPIPRKQKSIEKRVVFISRLDPKKGVKELVEKWISLQITHNWVLDIYGWGDENYIEEIRLLISGSGRSDVNLLGSVYGNDKEQVLLSADAFILPSYSEGLPMAILEAWSYGLPVLMTLECNLPVGFEQNAAIKISHKTLLDDLLSLIQTDNQKLLEIGRNGRDLIENRFLWTRIASDVADKYRESLC